MGNQPDCFFLIFWTQITDIRGHCLVLQTSAWRMAGRRGNYFLDRKLILNKNKMYDNI